MPLIKTLGIMGALPEEVALVTGVLEKIDTKLVAGVTYHIGIRSGIRLIVCCGGMGKVNAASTAQVLISHFKVDAILFSGIAGNMSAALGVGDVVIGSELVYHDADLRMLAQSAPGTTLYQADPLLLDVVQQACRLVGVNFLVGRIATGDQFVGDGETKRRIRDVHQPLAVEMEGAAVAHVAMRNQVPFVVLRSLSDNCDESIESLGAEDFDISEYVKTASAIVVASVDALHTLQK